MKNQQSLKRVIDSIHTGTKFPAIQLVKPKPEEAALISKLIKSKDPTGHKFDIEKSDSYYNLNQSQIQAVSDSAKSRIRDNENIIQLFPDIELAIQILVSSILSPKDMVKSDIIYTTKDSILSSELTLKLNTIIKNQLENHYNIKNELQTILRLALFDRGSYIKAVLPESIIDEIINRNVQVTTESLSEIFKPNNQINSLGILGKPGKFKTSSAMERFANSTHEVTSEKGIFYEDRYIAEDLLEITDNFKLLKMPLVNDAFTKSRIKSIIKPKRSAMESDKISGSQLGSMLYKEAPNRSETFMVIPTPANAKRKSVGRPLILNLPSESVIPIYIPGDHTKHVGYFVLTDIDGNPVTINSQRDTVEGLSNLISNQSNNQSLSSLLLQKARKNLINSDLRAPTIDEITKVYSSIIETDLISRLKNGIYGDNVSIGNNQEIYRIMLARSLSAKFTRLVYIPGELVTYFAFKYHDNGVGKSYLDDLKVLTSLRAILLFSKVMAMTKNSIALTHVNMTLDPKDPDPQKTIEMSVHEIVKMRQQYFPLGINSPVDLVDWIQRAGFEFSFEGHPGLPQTKFDFETKNLQHILPDNELDELLRKQTYMGFGLSPEIVDNGFNSEFATTAIANNILLSKRVSQTQDIFTEKLSDFCHKVTLNDTVIIDELLEVLKTNKGLVEKTLTDNEKVTYNENTDGFLMDLLERFIDNVRLELPKPDITSIETQSAAFDQYVESLDKTIDAWISSDMFSSDLTGEVSSNVDSIKTVVKGYFMRKWMSDNGFMSELNDIVTSDEDGNPTMDIYNINKGHMEGVIRSCIKFIESLKDIKQAADKDLENMNVEPGSPEESSPSETETESEAGTDEFAEPEPTAGEEDLGF